MGWEQAAGKRVLRWAFHCIRLVISEHNDADLPQQSSEHLAYLVSIGVMP